MNQSPMKHRAGYGSDRSGGGGFGNRNPFAGGGGGGGGGRGKFPQGLYDRLPLSAVSLWCQFLGEKTWPQQVWDSELGEVIEANEVYFQYTAHFARAVPPRGWFFHCSCGVERDKPCYGCAINAEHWRRINKIEEETGVRPKDEPRIGRQRLAAFAVALMEDMVPVPVRNDDGSPRKRKNGSPLINYTPKRLVQMPGGAPYRAGSSGPTDMVFGARMHFSAGKTAFNQLMAFNEELKNSCRNCARDMFAKSIACPNCETVFPLQETITGQTLHEERQVEYDCSTCNHHGQFLPMLECECQNPREGGLLFFEVQLKSEKLGDNASMLSITGIRLPSQGNTPERAARLKELRVPLELDKIFAPTAIEDQKRRLGDIINGVDPTDFGGGKTHSEGYGDGTSDDGDEPMT